MDYATSLSRVGLIAIVTTTLVTGCAVPPTVDPDPAGQRLLRVQPRESVRALRLEDPGIIIVQDGTDCGRSAGGGEVVALEGSFELPGYANAATVFLNGWRLEYLQSDHEVTALSADIREITLAGGALSWLARGHIRDHNFDDGYRFCYTYTVVAWNDDVINAVVDHADQHVAATSSEGDDTALITVSRHLESSGLADKDTVASLPRGFAYYWQSGDDHHMLQTGYHLEHDARFVERDKPYDRQLLDPPLIEPESRVAPEIATWQSFGIFKDNAGRRNYVFEEHASALGGDDVGVVDPPFFLLPHEDVGFASACIGEASGIKTEEVSITGVPFEYAVPVLSGWALAYGCDDEHVTDIGIWLEDVEYTTVPTVPTGVSGTLRYKVSSILHDKDEQPGHFFRHKVNILGFDARSPADLVPDADDPQLCDKDERGRLVVGVANQGEGEAPASVARVRFRPGGTVERAAPPVPAGFAGKLEPISIPDGCGADCAFTVSVDVRDEVTESNEVNNTSDGLCIG